VDSTGLKLCGADECLLEKHGTKTHRAWRTLHIGTDAHTDHIVATALSGWRFCPAHASLPGMTMGPNPYRGFRYPAEVIEHAVWLYHCFSLSLRDVETILSARGVVVSYESIRAWGLRFGRQLAKR